MVDDGPGHHLNGHQGSQGCLPEALPGYPMFGTDDDITRTFVRSLHGNIAHVMSSCIRAPHVLAGFSPSTSCPEQNDAERCQLHLGVAVKQSNLTFSADSSQFFALTAMVDNQTNEMMQDLEKVMVRPSIWMTSTVSHDSQGFRVKHLCTLCKLWVEWSTQFPEFYAVPSVDSDSRTSLVGSIFKTVRMVGIFKGDAAWNMGCSLTPMLCCWYQVAALMRATAMSIMPVVSSQISLTLDLSPVNPVN